jgi:cytochrome P450
MTHDSVETVSTWFDHYSPDYAQNWRDVNAGLRTRCPVAHSDNYGGFFVLTRYKDVERALKDDDTFASRHELDPDSMFGGIIIPPSPQMSTPIEMDPPEFFDYRKILNSFFSPAASERWRPFVLDVTTALLDQVVAAGRMEIVEDLGSPVPAVLTLEILGLPLSDWKLYSDAYHAIVYCPPGTPEFDEAQSLLVRGLEQCAKTVLERRAEPRDDLISVLAAAQVNGAPISVERILEMCNLLLAGGTDTTTGTLANIMVWLSQHPDQRDWLAADPTRIGPAIEEFLRYFTPTQALARTVTNDVEIGGQQLHRGDRVLLSFAAANFDPEVFESPNEVQLDRFPNRHQAFGLGIHRCLGSNLARMDIGVMLAEILRRMPDFVVDAAGCVGYETIGVVNGWHRVPITFTPSAPVDGTTFQL